MNASGSSRRGRLVVLVALLLSCLVPLTIASLPRSVAAAEGPPFTIAATASFGGAFKVGEWYPVSVTIENQGPDTAVEVRATTGPAGSEMTAVAPVELPAGARKEVVLYTLPESLPRQFDVIAVQTRGGEAIARTPVKLNPHFPTDTLCGVGGYKGGALAALGRVVPAGATDAIAVAPVDLNRFPTLAEGLYSFDCLVIGASGAGEAPAPLGPEQQRALAAWVDHGGQLIVATGERWQSVLASVPENLLPLTLTGTETLADLAGVATIGGGPAATGSTVITLGTMREGTAGGNVLATAGERPLVIERPVGDGVVHLLTFDPGAAPFVAWDGMDAFWQTLIRPSADSGFAKMGPADINPRLMETAPLVGALSTLPALDLPSLKLLAILLAVYVVAVSPVNYLVLKRLNRLSWAWATTILLVGLFTLGSYGLGRRIRGDDIVVNRLSIVQSDGIEGSAVSARTYVALFSPSKANYQVEVGGAGEDVLVSPMPPTSDPWSPWARTGGGGTIVQSRPAAVRDFGVGQWASRFFMAEHHPTDAPRVEAALRFEGNQLLGSITNVSEVKLTGAVVFVGNAVAEMGTLDPGQTVEVRLTLSGNTGPNNMGMPLSMRLLGFDGNGPWPGDRGGAAGREFQTRQMILDTLFGYGQMGPVTPSGVNLIAWAETGTLPITIEGRKAAVHDLLLLSSHLPVAFDGETVTLPAGTVTAHLVASQAESVSVYPSEIQIYNGYGDFEFTLPAEARPSTVTSLTLFLPDWGMGGGPPPPEVAIYDVTTDEYFELDDNRGAIEIPDPERYVDLERGTVRVRLSSVGADSVYTSLDIALTGDRAPTSTDEVDA